jgi:hypothetical protein
MPLQTSGPISSNNIQTEFGGINPISLSEYYAGGDYVLAGSSGTNGAIPSSGTISFSKFYGTSALVYNSLFRLSTTKLLNWDSTFTFPISSKGAVDSNKNVYLGYGQYTSGGSPGNFRIIKTDSSGARVWSKTFNMTTDSAAIINITGIAIRSSDGATFYAGTNDTTTSNSAGAFIFSLDASGNIRWSKRIQSTDINLIKTLYYDNINNRLYIAGSALRTSYDTAFTLSLNPNTGERTDGCRYFDINTKEYETITNNFDYNNSTSNFISGIAYVKTTKTPTINKPGVFVAKINIDGTIQWQRFIASTTNRVRDLFCLGTTGQSVYVGVESFDGDSNLFQLLVKISAGTGAPDYKWKFDNSTGQSITLRNACINKSSNEYYVVGDFKTTQGGYSSAFILKYSSLDAELWKRSITIPFSDCRARSVWLSQDGGTVYVMFTYDNDTKQAIAKLPADGTEMGKYTLIGSSTIVRYDSCPVITRSNSTFLVDSFINGLSTNTAGLEDIVAGDLALVTENDNSILPGSLYTKLTHNTYLDTQTVVGAGRIRIILPNGPLGETYFYTLYGYSDPYGFPDPPNTGTCTDGTSNLYDGAKIRLLSYQTATTGGTPTTTIDTATTFFEVTGSVANAGWTSMIVTGNGSGGGIHYFDRSDATYYNVSGFTGWYWQNRILEGTDFADATVQFV